MSAHSAAPTPVHTRLVVNQCPICKSQPKNSTQLLQDHVGLEVFTLVQCSQCLLHYLKDPPHPENLPQYYQNPSGSTMRSRSNRFNEALRTLLVKRQMAPLLKNLPPNHVFVDFGAGGGITASTLHRLGIAVEAWDVYPSRDWPHAKVPYRQVDFNDLLNLSPPPPLNFDKVPKTLILRHVLEHLYQPVSFFKQAQDLGARRLFIIVPNGASPWATWLGRYWFFWDPPRHLVHFQKESLRELARQSGWEMEFCRDSGIDEWITSLHRYLSIRFKGNPKWNGIAKWSQRFLSERSALTSLSAAFSSLFLKNVLEACFTRKESAPTA